ncbi:hypothetical protein WJX73_001458 [Symbiochloris irregularis]|uniref:Uncharacterized protein n=1 Tax=Symbiochloris irregularis TaxID=706552 RepID=A0AAW1PII6_9CHLO
MQARVTMMAVCRPVGLRHRPGYPSVLILSRPTAATKRQNPVAARGSCTTTGTGVWQLSPGTTSPCLSQKHLLKVPRPTNDRAARLALLQIMKRNPAGLLIPHVWPATNGAILPGALDDCGLASGEERAEQRAEQLSLEQQCEETGRPLAINCCKHPGQKEDDKAIGLRYNMVVCHSLSLKERGWIAALRAPCTRLEATLNHSVCLLPGGKLAIRVSQITLRMQTLQDSMTEAILVQRASLLLRQRESDVKVRVSVDEDNPSVCTRPIVGGAAEQQVGPPKVFMPQYFATEVHPGQLYSSQPGAEVMPLISASATQDCEIEITRDAHREFDQQSVGGPIRDAYAEV